MQEEIFGPVCAIAKFETEEEVLKLGNDSVYGLAAAVHTQDLNTAIRVSNALHAGTVWVNCYKYVHIPPMLEKTLLTPPLPNSLAAPVRRVQIEWYRSGVGRGCSGELHAEQERRHPAWRRPFLSLSVVF